MHSRIASIASIASPSSRTGLLKSSPVSLFPGHPATVHSWSDAANFPSCPGHPNKMASRLGFASPSRSGHPTPMHSRTAFVMNTNLRHRNAAPLKSCLKRPDSALSTDPPSAPQKKKTVHFPSRLTQVRVFLTPGLKGLCEVGLEKLYLANVASKTKAMIYACPFCPGRFITKLPGVNAPHRVESRKSISWSSVRRARFGSLAKTFNWMPVPVSDPVDFEPLPVLAASKPQDATSPTSQVAVVRLPQNSSPRQVIDDRKVQPYVKASVFSQTLFRYLLAMIILLGFFSPDIWTVLLLIFVGYSTIWN